MYFENIRLNKGESKPKAIAEVIYIRLVNIVDGLSNFSTLGFAGAIMLLQFGVGVIGVAT
jgi:hypothetical protein